ncbi:sigma-70 family RNA polymerase sigma factor [Chitinispirillales bacterium ANBcel5]|uniref:RNA polymerase sigma factor n=1 Tax=Cellulosispirillum alkaliphilum TaxID=3039283 RepID=UPI002A592895|nr:sigma-70 family RNA polymerase sigma factor [Chitinispirillales bacterium ANBcel5]
MHQQTNDDQHLFDLWLSGNSQGFSQLYDKYKNRVFGFLLRMTGDREIAEDLLQETFFAALRNAEQFDRSRSFLSWLFGIAHKRTIDFFRHAKVETEHKQDTDGSVGSKLDAPDQQLSNQSLRDLINEAVEKLDPLQREVFLLREMGGVPFKEIAKIMDCPINTALGRMRLALKNIRKELKKRGIDGVQ